ncbi:MAG: YceI family protein [Opitutae bacterium]
MKGITIFCAFLPLMLLADSKSFDFKDPKGVNTVIFQLDALLESINGSAGGISGKVLFDPDAPENTTGSIILDASSLRVDNPVLQEHMHGKEWLDVAKFPQIEFSLAQLEKISRDNRSIRAEAAGKMTIRNVTMKMTVPIELTYLPDLLEKRNKVPGDLLVVRSRFKVKRDDFGIKPGEYLDKVANEIEISINLAGAFPKG